VSRVVGPRFSRASLVIVLLLVVSAAAAAQQQMPDPSQIHGRAIPAPELPSATVTVRLVRENIGNNVPGQQVIARQGTVTRVANTDDEGRATFKDLPAGSNWTAEATIDGEVLTSEPFTVPADGGLRVILVAGLARAAERRQQEDAKALEAPPVKGTVVLGGDTRVLMQFSNDRLQVFYVLEIVNNARSRVDIGGPLIIDLPRVAAGAGTLEGSSPSATITDNRLTVLGPFGPGTTPVQVGFSYPYTSSDVRFEQKFPVPLQQVTVGVQRVRELEISSPQFTQTRNLSTEDGVVFAIGSGPGLPAGGTLIVDLKRLPVASSLPSYIALALAGAIVAIGVWLSVVGVTRAGDQRPALLTRRDALLKDLEQLEVRHRKGAIGDERYTSSRERIVGELEHIYSDLDEAGHGPQGGGEGIAA
jgi:hypothetical protein